MKLLDNSLSVTSWDRWEDPGDYPNGIATCTLPAGPWKPDDTEGCGIYRLEKGDWEELQEAHKEGCLDDYFDDLQLDIGGDSIDHLKIKEYRCKHIGEFLVVTPEFKDCASPCPVEEAKKNMEWLKTLNEDTN